MIAYIDTSVAIPFIIGEDITIRHALNFPTVIATLDALHLSTALCHPKVNEAAAVSLFSNDRQMNLCAAALGMLTPLSVS